MNGALLQHGSLLIEIDHSLWTLLFPHATALEAHATALRCLLERSPSWEELVEAFRGGFEEGAGVRLDPDELTIHEEMLVEQLVATRYGTPEWTSRR
jgi:lipoate-protein ligase A